MAPNDPWPITADGTQQGSGEIMKIRKKLAAFAMTGGILAGGLVMATPASAIGTTTCPPETQASHGLEVFAGGGNYCWAGSAGWIGFNSYWIADSLEYTAGWISGEFYENSYPVGVAAGGRYYPSHDYTTGVCIEPAACPNGLN